MSLGGRSNLRIPSHGRRLRLGFVGGGRGGLVGEWHAAGARLSNRWEVVAGALSSDPINAAESAKDWLIAADRSYADYHDMARAEATRPDGIDAVVICTPNWNHYEAAATFMRAGIDVILDKPMTTSLADAESLVRLQRETGLALVMTYPYTYHAMVRQARHMVEAGAVGPIRLVHVEYLQEWGVEPPDPGFKGALWRRDPAKAGRASAGADIGTHAYHLLHYVSGKDVTDVRAEFHVCGAPKDMEDTVFANIRLEGGIPGLLWLTQAAPGQYCGLRLRIWGEKGGLEWDQQFPEQLRYTPLGGAEQTIVRGRGAGMLSPAENLVHLPRGHGEALTDAWGNLYAEAAIAIEARRSGRSLPKGSIEPSGALEGLQGMRFVEACVDSHEGGGVWVKLKRELAIG
jgi:predicted dehydrogenase